VNDSKPHWVAGLIRGAIEEISSTRKCAEKEVTVALLGLSFKPDIDDLRESPALEIASGIAASSGVNLLFVEPHIEKLPEDLSHGRLCDLEYAVGNADVIAVLVAHGAFRTLTGSLLSGKKVIDAVGILG
jgi:UDP-N-acetyl-D-mannosaminuronic acid dehydrogenase